jgi:hypothetical protein
VKKSMFWWLGLSTCLAAVGCGDDAGETGNASQGASRGEPAGAGGGSGSGGSSGSGEGAGRPDDRIDPIAMGRAWTYQVEELGAFPLCPSGIHTGSTISEGEVHGKHAFEVTSLCANVDSSFYAVDGDVVQVEYQGTWILALDAPVEEGHTWSNGASTFTWHDAGSVTVPAGTFDDCWVAEQNVDYDAYTIFCRGVGPVHWHSEDLLGNGFDAVLTEKNF